MGDEVPLTSRPNPEPPDSPGSDPRPRVPRKVLDQKRPDPGGVGTLIGGALCITTAAGIFFALAIPRLLSSQGARYSVRIEWQRRDAELDAAADQAIRDGKLPPPSAEASRRE